MHVYPLRRLRLPLVLGLLLLLLLLLLLTNDLAGVVFHQHVAVRFQLLYGDGQPEVVEEEELELQVVELDEGEAADLDEDQWMLLVWVVSCFLGWSGSGEVVMGMKEAKKSEGLPWHSENLYKRHRRRIC